jgi:hypothetical protein
MAPLDYRRQAVHRGRPERRLAISFAVAVRWVPGQRLKNDTSLAEVTRRAGDQGFVGVEVRGCEPLASSVRASWG